MATDKGYYATKFAELAPDMPGRIGYQYGRASASNLKAGALWYAKAHQTAKEIADLEGIKLRTSAGILAMLSPRVQWEVNVVAARYVAAKKKLPRLAVMHSLVVKARRIRGGTPIEAVCKGPKVLAFFQSILNPHLDHAVVVDTHAGRIALGEVVDEEALGRLIVRYYTEISDAYRTAAADLGIAPSTLQAITWLQHREERS